MKKRILVIDDEESVAFVIQEILTDMGYDVEAESDPEKGVRMALANSYDLMIVDLRMPGKNGAEITTEILAANKHAKIVINTGYPGDPLAQQALDAGAINLIKKPFEIEKIYDLLKDG